MIRRIPTEGFRIAFTGNIGTAQGLDILPRAAELVKKEDPNTNIQFIIVGDGRYQPAFEEEIRQRQVGELFTMIPRQPAEGIPKILACCDAAFLSFADTKLWEMTIPAKLQSYMACGMPVIASARGETERVISDAQCGVCCDIGDAQALADAIREMASESEVSLWQMRDNSRRYAERHYDKKNLMDRMERCLRKEIC